MIKIAIVGAGVSGLTTAINLAKVKDAQIDIYERSSKAARKLLASGNGRCNITNCNVSSKKYNDYKFSNNIILNYPKMVEYLNSLGILLTNPDEDGRVYPISLLSQTVLDAFLDNINKKNTNIIYQTPVDNIKYKNKKFIINNKEYDYLVVTTGSQADEKLKVNEIDETIVNLNHTFTKRLPSLACLPVFEDVKALEGVRQKCNVKMIIDKEEFNNKGEIIFKKDEISGIVIFELANILANIRRKRNVKNVSLYIDFLPEEEFSYYYHTFIDEKYKKTHNDRLTLNGIFNKKLQQEIIKRADEFQKQQAKLDKEIQITNRSEILNNVIHSFKLSVNLNKTPSVYHVMSGGISLNEISDNLESKIIPNLYFGGEVIDINGDCGGYNLHFAISSGIRIAKSIKEAIK